MIAAAPRTAITIAMALALLAPQASAQAIGSRTIDLGGGVSVARAPMPIAGCRRGCYPWEPSGFSFGREAQLAWARTWGRWPTGRITAFGPARPGRIGRTEWASFFTDDLGATWHRASWTETWTWPSQLAMDPAGARGVAIGPSGSIWSTEDGGARWRRRRTASGVTYVAAWVRARTVVVQDDGGTLWLARDGGFALETLPWPGARVIERGTELVLADASRTRASIDARGVLHRN